VLNIVSKPRTWRRCESLMLYTTDLAGRNINFIFKIVDLLQIGNSSWNISETARIIHNAKAQRMRTETVYFGTFCILVIPMVHDCSILCRSDIVLHFLPPVCNFGLYSLVFFSLLYITTCLCLSGHTLNQRKINKPTKL
jgi:hypothetical protein